MTAHFVTSPPSHQNAADIFRGRWVSRLPVPSLVTGEMNLFSDEDRRPRMAVDVLGSIEGFRILELGPLEGAHSYQLERLGAASVLAIEASPDLFLKCLITKEILDLKARFLLGDFVQYLESTADEFDLIFVSGVLYHMTDPVHLLYLISRIAPRAFIWTHYVPDDFPAQRRSVEAHGFQCDYYPIGYDPEAHGRGWSGVASYACRLRKSTILEALSYFGFDRVVVTEDAPTHPGGPAVSIVCMQTERVARTLDEQVDLLRHEARYHANTANELRLQLSAHRAELGELNALRAELEEKGEIASDQATNQTRTELDRVLQSRSWRLTAPLRWVGARARSVRGDRDVPR